MEKSVDGRRNCRKPGNRFRSRASHGAGLPRLHSGWLGGTRLSRPGQPKWAQPAEWRSRQAGPSPPETKVSGKTQAARKGTWISTLFSNTALQKNADGHMVERASSSFCYENGTTRMVVLPDTEWGRRSRCPCPIEKAFRAEWRLAAGGDGMVKWRRRKRNPAHCVHPVGEPHQPGTPFRQPILANC